MRKEIMQALNLFKNSVYHFENDASFICEHKQIDHTPIDYYFVMDEVSGQRVMIDRVNSQVLEEFQADITGAHSLSYKTLNLKDAFKQYVKSGRCNRFIPL